jgi:phosphatidylglycerol:prolipoprotein diacylglycerol transferase
MRRSAGQAEPGALAGHRDAGIILAQAIGRMGNRINQELYGPSTDLPWAFHINPAYPCQEPTGSPNACALPERQTPEALQWYAENGYHPVFFYEALWNLVGFVLVMWGGRKFYSRLRDGDLFCFYLIWYPLGRFLVEFLRPDAWRMGALATAQWVSLISIVLGVAGILWNHRKSAPAPAPVGGTVVVK